MRGRMGRASAAVRSGAARMLGTWPRRIAFGLVLVIVVPVLTAGVALRLNFAA